MDNQQKQEHILRNSLPDLAAHFFDKMETELCAEAEEMQARLAARKQEMEEIARDMEAKIEVKLRKDNQQKQEEERSERKAETELDDMKEQAGERKQQVEEMQLLLGKREERAYTLDVVKQIKKAG
jgi:hypothetical protein